ncbi:MAG TPA: hypothetical protein VMV72_06395 [Verrucomicrobiae bacterium]|nr:hypothetical protein [Verrucomicrobiae bacterium]
MRSMIGCRAQSGKNADATPACWLRIPEAAPLAQLTGWAQALGGH